MAMHLASVSVRAILASTTKNFKIQQMTFAESLKASKITPILGTVGQEKTKKLTDVNLVHDLHVSSQKSYPLAKPLPLPDNVEDIDDSELACFSPQRVRDISGSVILSKAESSFGHGYRNSYNQQSHPIDPHVASYDCSGALSLNSVMQTNVPEPFSSSGKSTHLNMPGGQWGQGQKYISEDMQNIHYSKMTWNDSGSDGQGNTYLPQKTLNSLKLLSFSSSGPIQAITNRAYCTSNSGGEPSRKDKLKRAIKEYGSTVVVFHVGISLLSLGGCYLAVTSGVNMGGMMTSLGAGSEVAAEAGQFVVAYAVHKMFAPVRISITLASTPFIVRYLRKIGFLKVPKPPVL